MAPARAEDVAQPAAPQAPAPQALPLGSMQRVALQDGVPYQVGIGALPTTILMPAPIEQFFAEGVTVNPAIPAPVYLDGQTGQRFFSVKALLPGVADVNVLCDGRLYSFRFALSDSPTRTLTVLPPEQIVGKKRAPKRITADRLFAILQEAKSYFIVQAEHPYLGRGIEVAAPGTLQRAGTHRTIVDHIFRFDADDTFVFRVIFLNDTFQRLTYRPEDSAIRIGQNVYWASFADLSGEIPPARPGYLDWKPARDGIAAHLTKPDGSNVAVTTTRITVLEPGTYTLTLSELVARADKPRSESISFVVDPLTNQIAPPVASLNMRPRSEPLLEAATLTQPQPSQTFGYILITGNPDGSRANISIQNIFSVILPVSSETEASR